MKSNQRNRFRKQLYVIQKENTLHNQKITKKEILKTKHVFF